MTGERTVATAIGAERASDVKITIIDRPFLAKQVSSDIADILARLPGVALQGEGGETRFVQVRGVRPELGAVTLDGLPVGAPDPQENGRQFPLDLFSSRLFERVEIAKVAAPSAEGEGIGGTVNIVSIDPFTRPDAALDLRVGAGEDSLLSEATALGGVDLGGDAAAAFGVSWSQTEREFGLREQRSWRDFGDVALPYSVRTAAVEDDIRRLNAMLSAAWVPLDGHRLGVRVLAGLKEKTRQRDRYEDRIAAADGNDVVGTARAALGVLGDEDRSERSLVIATLEGDHALGARTQLDWTLSASRGESHTDYLRWVFLSDPVRADSRYEVAPDGFVSLTGTGADLVDALRMDLHEDKAQDLVEDIQVADVTLRHQLTAGLTLEAGARWRQRERRFDAENLSQTPGSDFFLVPQFALPLALQQTPVGRYPVYILPFDDIEMYDGPARATFADRVLTDLIASTLSDYDLTETVTAAFVSGRYEQGPLTVLAGVRAERTEFDANGVFLSLAGIEPRRESTERTDWLPSLAASWRPQAQWQLRVAAGRRLARPGLHVATPNAGLLQDGNLAELVIGNPALETRVSDNYDLTLEYYPAPDFVIGASLFRIDIDMDIITVVDAYLGAAAGEVLDGFGLAPLGRVDYLRVNQSQNVQDYGLDGIELYLSGTLGFVSDALANLSATASYTSIDERGSYERGGVTEPIRAPEQTPQQAALTLSWDAGRLGLSASARWGDDYISGLGESVYDDTRQRASGAVDAQFTYELSDRIAVRLEATNLTDAVQVEYDGIDPSRPALVRAQPRALFLGARFSL